MLPLATIEGAQMARIPMEPNCELARNIGKLMRDNRLYYHSILSSLVRGGRSMRGYFTLEQAQERAAILKAAGYDTEIKLYSANSAVNRCGACWYVHIWATDAQIS